MCRGTVAAPSPLQDIVYPILSEKSLLFCEKMQLYRTFHNSNDPTSPHELCGEFAEDAPCVPWRLSEFWKKTKYQFHYSKPGRVCQSQLQIFGKKHGKCQPESAKITRRMDL